MTSTLEVKPTTSFHDVVTQWAPSSDETRLPLLLTIDDDPDVSRSIEMQMRTYAVRVKCAFFGTQGFWESVRERPDLIVMDLAMPNGDGHYLLNCLKQNQSTANIPVIVLTGMRDPQLRAQTLAAGADVYLSKPIAFDELVHHVSRFIDMRRTSEQGGMA